MKRINDLITIERLSGIIYLEVCLLVISKIDLNTEVLSDLRQVLITSTSIFSAIVIGILVTGINNHIVRIQKHKERLDKLSNKLTSFRRMLYYLSQSYNIWDCKFYGKFLRKISELYPHVNANTNSHEVKEGNRIYEIVKDDRFGYLTTRLFLAFITIVDTKKREELTMISPSSKFSYSRKKLEYMYESFNNLWYFLAHKKANVTISAETFNQIYNEDFSKQLRILFGDKVTIDDLNEKMVIDIGNEFYHEHIPEMYDHINIITKGAPRLLKFLLYELIFILVLGLLLPIITFMMQDGHFISIMKVSIVTVLFTYGLIVYHLMAFIQRESRSY